MGIGVITHLKNATIAETVALARAAEAAGADWVGVPDAFWWRDAWVLLAEVARGTRTIAIGPLVTNPYLRHPFHTVAAVATLEEIAGPRLFVGIGAGGSEVSGAAGISRRDAPERIEALARLLRGVSVGQPLDAVSGRSLEVSFTSPTILVAGRGDGVLRAAGRVADRAMLWAVPDSELERSIAQVAAGAESRPDAATPAPEIVWAPLVEHDDESRRQVIAIAAYSVLNSRRELRERWGIAPAQVTQLRRALVAGGAANAATFVPAEAVEDLVTAPDPIAVGARAASIGAASIALPAFDIETVGARVAWAREVLARAASFAPAPVLAPARS
jgi:5,10-methylenetetrahydromethanopterin reductase